ncbi:MAG TPA: LysM peptidoglycan-binding domain-containing protein [Acidimicrobiales bacterium]|nr:LysM peptidoglycan-binding domain-containing protein [Acidimicrobiales bacterium]
MHRFPSVKALRAAVAGSPRLRLAAAVVAVTGLLAGGLADYSSASDGGYVVQPGDSLWAIASAHGISVAQLASANHLDPGAILPIGRHLYLPGSAPATQTVAAAAVITPSHPSANAWSFCSSFVASPGPYGALPARLEASADRLALRPLFEKWAAHYGLSLPLLEAVDWQESGWQQGVVSSTGAVGVGQIMPGTGVFISNVLIGEPMNLNSVSDNIRMSAAFLAYLAHVEGDNRCATIAAYYEGPLNLSAYGVFPDTQTYVADVEALLPRFE